MRLDSLIYKSLGIPRFDENGICSSDSGVAKNARVINRIDAVQAARDKPASVLGIL
jgi:hypothetical protein